MVAAAAATALRVRLGGVAAAHAGRDARPPWAEVAENAALEPPSQRVALRSPGWLLCMCSIVVAFHGRASKVCGVVGEAATSRCLGGPEAPLEASPDDACAREPRPGSAETGAAAAPGSASAIIKEFFWRLLYMIVVVHYIARINKNRPTSIRRRSDIQTHHRDRTDAHILTGTILRCTHSLPNFRFWGAMAIQYSRGRVYLVRGPAHVVHDEAHEHEKRAVPLTMSS